MLFDATKFFYSQEDPTSHTKIGAQQGAKSAYPFR